MPTKKETKKKNTKKRGKALQKQKQSQVQKVIVNINKPTAKSSKQRNTAGSRNASSKAPSYSSQPIFQAEINPYPSYIRQAAAVTIAQPESVIQDIPIATLIPSKKRRQEVPLFSVPPESVKAVPVNMFDDNKKESFIFKARPEFQKPEPEQEVDIANIYEKPKDIYTPMENNPLLKTKRKYVRKNPDIPRKNSTEDLLNRYQSAVGKPYDGPVLKVNAFKELVEDIEKRVAEVEE